MLTFDESASEQRIKIFDRRAEADGPVRQSAPDNVVPVHRGDVFAPPLPAADPLLVQCAHFIECVRTGRRPRSDGAQGLEVVRVLEAGQRSIEAGGVPAPVG
jgi:predicted dehydrogenase